MRPRNLSFLRPVPVRRLPGNRLQGLPPAACGSARPSVRPVLCGLPLCPGAGLRMLILRTRIRHPYTAVCSCAAPPRMVCGQSVRNSRRAAAVEGHACRSGSITMLPRTFQFPGRFRKPAEVLCCDLEWIHLFNL